ncbi:MAG: Rid family detoxifying hydrolase [Hydrogenophilus sp.]|nr:Rid family detoxifying hydrolase [Hydrogenophilus sp.]
MKRAISTRGAPQAIGAYAQAVRAGDFVFVSGQLGMDPETMELADGFEAQCRQMFANLTEIAVAAGSSLADAVKLTIFLTDLGNFPTLNAVMAEFVPEPFPARATVEVSALPRGALVEADAILFVQR